MARKQSSKIYFQGKYHNEIYFQGHYHDKMYIGNQLVWEKLAGGNYSAYIYGDRDFYGSVGFGAKAVYKNDLYALGQMYDKNSKVSTENTICRFDFENRVWEYIASFGGQKKISISDNENIQDMHAGSYGVVSNDLSIFYGYDGKTSIPPASDNVFFAAKGQGQIVLANKGTIEYNESDYGFIYKDFSGNEISRIDFGTQLYCHDMTEHDGNVYAIVESPSYVVFIYKISVDESNAISYETISAYANNPSGTFPRYTTYFFVPCGEKLYISTVKYESSSSSQNVYLNLDLSVAYETGDFVLAAICDDIVLLAHKKSNIIKKGINGQEITVTDKWNKFVVPHKRFCLRKDKETGEYHVYYGTYEINDDGTTSYIERVEDMKKE